MPNENVLYSQDCVELLRGLTKQQCICGLLLSICVLVQITIFKRDLHLDDASIAEKLVGFSSDGASVMVGAVGGVATRLRKHAPRLQQVHCLAHCNHVSSTDQS